MSDTHLKKTVGDLMVRNVPIVHENSRISEVEKLLIKKARDFESINYIYVVNEEEKLKGIASVKEIFQSAGDTGISEVMERKIISVNINATQERAAITALKNSLKSVPVLDKEGKFLGVVTSDVILNILHKEHVEDFLKSAGIHHGETSAVQFINEMPLRSYFGKRLPWLIIGLVGGILAAFVVEMFEGVLKEEIMLAAFIPVIVYMADAVGVQSQTIFIRFLALDGKIEIKRYFLREIKTSMLLAVVLGVILSLLVFLWLGSLPIAMVLVLSMIATVIIAAFIAVLLPWIFMKSRFDPAIASGPFATVIRDILSLVIYFLIAYLIIF